MRFPPKVLLLLTPVLAFAALGPARADEKPEEKTTKKASVAHIKLSDDLEEKAPRSDPLLGTLGETFRTKIDRIRKASNDKNIDALYLEINGLVIGWGKLDELAHAIADFRKGGKKVFAHFESGTTKDYLVALACNDVCFPESAWLMLTGIRAEVSFYKDLFDKIGVKADMLQMGEYKSAAEPYTRTSLSQPARKQLDAVLDDFYEKSLVGRIVKGRPARKFSAEKVKEIIDGGPYSARAALKLGLIDRLAYADEYPDTMKALLEVDEVKVVRNYARVKHEDLDIFSLYKKLLFGPSKASSSRALKVAVIYATGVITTGKGGSSLLAGEVVGSDTMIKAIRQAENDKTVKAIVLRVDSPGGSALASDLIWNELKRCKKPVIASMSDVAASGGYYLSMSAKKIYAEPGTLTGSIGVVGGKLALGGLYNKIGIKTETISRGAHAGLLSSTEPFSKSERETFKRLMQDVYDQFLDKALEGRKQAGKKMTREELVKLAGGRIWTGRQAKENGLIDELGTLEDAIRAAAKMGGLPADKVPEVLLLPKPKGFLDQLLESQSDTRLPGLDAGLLPVINKVPGLKEKLRPVEGLLRLRGQPVWMVLPYQVEIK